MTPRERLGFLVGWALRDEAMALAQARLDDVKAPGILAQLEYQLHLRDEFARTGSDWTRIVGETVSATRPAAKKGRRK